MSSYINFFVKRKNIYVPIGSFCRSSVIYREFDGEYEKIKPLTSEKLTSIYMELKEEKMKVLKDFEDYKREFEEYVAFIQKMNNTLNEKLDAIAEKESFLKEYKREIDEMVDDIEIATSFCYFLSNILDEALSYDDIDEDFYIFYGVEVPYSVVNEDKAE